MNEPTIAGTTMQPEPELHKKSIDPKGVLQKNMKPVMYLGAAALVILAAVFSAHTKPSSLLADVGDVGQAGRLLRSDHVLFRLASPTSLRTAESRRLIVEGESDSMAARHSINKDRERGQLAQKANRSSTALA
jgi:hypothetical protein